jgi:hypothetical protein
VTAVAPCSVFWLRFLLNQTRPPLRQYIVGKFLKTDHQTAGYLLLDGLVLTWVVPLFRLRPAPSGVVISVRADG